MTGLARERLIGRRQRRRACVALLCALLPAIPACVYLRPLVVPIASETYHREPGNRVMVILLPGLRDSPSSFVANDVVAKIRGCRPDANIVGVHAHYGYYREKILWPRLRQDIVLPARDAGIEEFWLLGVSMGGLGSLLYRHFFPDDTQGVIIMAPYLGENEDFAVYLEKPDRRPASLNADFVDLWDGLAANAPSRPEITLAFGEDDDFHLQHDWLAQLLDEQRVISEPGGHSWSLWRDLWPRALASSGLCTRHG